jgi:LCP family protein required for cell wall assembly
MSERPSPAVAGALSLLFPGLGQAYVRRFGRALLVALPALLLVAAALVALTGGWAEVAGALMRPGVLVGLLVGGALFFAYHVAAIVDAYLLAGRVQPAPGRPHRRRGRAASGVALVVLLAAAMAVHGVPWYLGYRAAPNLAALFHEGADATDWTIPPPSWEVTPDPAVGGGATPSAGPTAAVPAASPTAGGTPAPATDSPTEVPATPTIAPTASPYAGVEWARDGQLNIVLLGSDEGPGRWSLRPDAIFLLSIDIETARSALFGFPRYMSNIPLPPEAAANFPDGKFPGYFNALYRAAQDRPGRYPGNDARGLRVMAGAIQELAGVRVDHYVMVNLNGFVDVVDAMGGLWIDVPEPGLEDNRYVVESGRRRVRLSLEPGCQKLDGRMALFFARSRHQDSDYHRMARQEVTIQAMRRQFDPLAVLPRLPELFDAAGDNLYWTLQPDDVAPMAQLAARVDADRMQRVLFVPPEYERELDDEIIERIRSKVRGIFGEPEPEPSARPGDRERCPPAN